MRLGKMERPIGYRIDLWFSDREEFHTWERRYKQHLVKINEYFFEGSEYHHYTFLFRWYPLLIDCHVSLSKQKEPREVQTNEREAISEAIV